MTYEVANLPKAMDPANAEQASGDSHLAGVLHQVYARQQESPTMFTIAASYDQRAANFRDALTAVQQEQKPDILDPKVLEAAGNAIGALILNRGRLEMDSNEGELTFLMAYDAYAKEGKEGVQKLVNAINKGLKGEFTLSMTDDPVLTESVKKSFEAIGKTPPEFVSLLKLQDNSGRPRGDVLFLYAPEPKGQPI